MEQIWRLGGKKILEGRLTKIILEWGDIYNIFESVVTKCVLGMGCQKNLGME